MTREERRYLGWAILFLGLGTGNLAAGIIAMIVGLRFIFYAQKDEKNGNP